MNATILSPENYTVSEQPDVSRGINIWGLVSVILFYLLILLIGVYAAWKSKSLKSGKTEDIMLANRNIGMALGVFTMTATSVGGGVINGTAEEVYKNGIVWAQAPVGYPISMFIGGLFFAKRMRQGGYVTMLDPYEQKYGTIVAALLYIPAVLSDTFWSSSILAALGASLAVILRISHDVAIAVSAIVAILYTVIGGLYSVSVTDVIQLICLAIGMALGTGFAYHHPAVLPLSQTARENPDWFTDSNVTWIGEVPRDPLLGVYIDVYLLFLLGGIPWQCYFQRVLSTRTALGAQVLSVTTPFLTLLLATPAAIIGAIARSTDWTQTQYRGTIPIPNDEASLVLPLVLEYLTPAPVAIIGLGAVSAAVMSSADSAVLSVSTMFARNVYKPIRNLIFRKRMASDSEIVWTMRISGVVFGAISVISAIKVNTIYGLLVLSSDLVYVILFPQLVAVFYLPFANSYGSLCGIITGLFFRIAGGEPLIGIPGVICYPYCSEVDGVIEQNFPVKTLSMLISLTCIIMGSGITHLMFKKWNVPLHYDVIRCFQPLKAEKDEMTKL